MRKILSLLLALVLISPLRSVGEAATGCNYPASLDSWVNKATGDFLTVADVNQRSCAIEALETGPLRPNDGTATAPAYAFRTSAGAGLFLASANNMVALGGAAVGSALTLRSTSGVGTTDAIIFQVGNNGATEAMRIFSSGRVGVGGVGTPGSKFVVQGAANDGVTLTSSTAVTIALLRPTGAEHGELSLFNSAGTQIVSLGGTTATVNYINVDSFGVGTTNVAALLHLGGDRARPLSIQKSTVAVVAPGAGVGTLRWEVGTNAGTLKLVGYSGTSTTGVTIVDNVGAGN